MEMPLNQKAAMIKQSRYGTLYISLCGPKKIIFKETLKEKEKGERAEHRTRTQARNDLKTLV